MTKPIVAQPYAYNTDVEQGKTYRWCACGRSATQPFCDDSHEGTGIEPVDYTATETTRVQFCGCKSTKNGAICDSSHNLL
ncbi:MAG: CDGSH iron-sulfur domain-containing protein [Alphaproteobacteria bacterium]|nr:CDGSH iron-sulfur domain-containing protein [Alphaproteobacteria bacterium]MBT5860115.1 CDGSH iron-sulfur domain-containing protein [Alphaproteobacteria bacterium]